MKMYTIPERGAKKAKRKQYREGKKIKSNSEDA